LFNFAHVTAICHNPLIHHFTGDRKKLDRSIRDLYIQGDTKKWELLKNPTKIEEIQEKKFIDRN